MVQVRWPVPRSFYPFFRELRVASKWILQGGNIQMKEHVRHLGAVSCLLVLTMIVTSLVSPQALAKETAPPAHFTQYNISRSGGFAIGITVDTTGNPWFGLGTGSVGTINHFTGALRVYHLANTNAGVGTVKLDKLGNVWVTEANAPGIAMLNPITGKEHEFLLPAASRKAGLTPTFLEIDQAGNKWFNEADFSDATGGKLGRLSPSGVITEWAVPTVGAEIEEIALDHEGNLWFAEQGNISFNPSPNKVGRLNPHAATITEYTSPTPNSRPAGIIVAADDTIWFSEHAADKIAHLFPNKARGVTTHVIPVQSKSSPSPSSQPGVPGAPTNPVKTTVPAVTAKISKTISQGIVEYNLPHTGSRANTEDMRFDSQGNLFYENDATAQIGELVLHDCDDPTIIHEWTIPHGVGFYNIEFSITGALWISDVANYGPGGSVYKFRLDV